MRPSSELCPIVVSLFDGVRPAVRDEWRGTWAEFVAGVLPALLAQETTRALSPNAPKKERDAAKATLPGIVFAEVDGWRSDITCGPLTALAVDVDHVPDLSALLAACARFACVVHETPSSGHPGKGARVRIIVALAQPIAGEHVPAARRAFAAEVGAQVDESALAHSQFMFAGRFAGDPERACEAFEGKVWTPPAVSTRKPRSAVGRTASLGKAPSGAAFGAVDLSPILPELMPAGHDDDRHRLSRALGGWLARRGHSPDEIARAVARLPSDTPRKRADEARAAALQARAGLEAPGWDYLSQRFGDDVCAALEAANRDPREPVGFGASGSCWSEWWAQAWSPGGWCARMAAGAVGAAIAATALGGQDGTGLRLAGTGWPMIVQKGTFYWFHAANEPTYIHHEVSSSELIAAAAREFAGCFDEDELTRAELDKHWVRPLADVRASYVARTHAYDPATNVLTLAALRWTKREPRQHKHIDRWLRAFFGDRYDAGAQWLASLVALDRPAPCLYVSGPHGIGKSLLASGLAGLWNLHMPVKMKEVISDFNESTGECPIVFTDEGFPDGLNFSEFRDMITEHARRVNRKNRAKYTVEGCARFYIAANNDELLRYQRTGTLTSSDLAAIADRLLVIKIDDDDPHVPKCVAAVKALDTNAAASHEIAEHVLWLAQTVALQPKGERMSARPGGGERILMGVVAARGGDVLSKIHEAMSMGGSHAAKLGVHVSKNWEGEVRVHVPTLTKALADSFSKAGRADVIEFCGSLAPPMRSGAVTTRVGSAETLRCRVLDRAKLNEARERLE